jgi:hypothetical protein
MSNTFEIYDEETNKTLHIEAPDLKTAEIIASYINFNDFTDGQIVITNNNNYETENNQ